MFLIGTNGEHLDDKNQRAHFCRQELPIVFLSDPSTFAPYSLSDFKTSASSANSVRNKFLESNNLPLLVTAGF